MSDLEMLVHEIISNAECGDEPAVRALLQRYGDAREQVGIEAVIADLESEHRYNVSCLGNPWNKGLKRAIDLAKTRLPVPAPEPKESEVRE